MSQVSEVDQWCHLWARQRRMALGIIDASGLEPKERLGKLRSTLGTIQKEKVGAGGGSAINQNFPEVYMGTALLVHRAQALMSGDLRLVMHLHYVWKEISAEEKCKEMRISKATYWTHVTAMKAFIHGAVLMLDRVEALSRQGETINSREKHCA